MINTFSFIANHPLTKNHKSGAYWRWVKWQTSSRLTKNKKSVPFVNDARLLVSSGMAGATGNIYCGLHEFEDMGFVLHFLRADDLFVDVGANVGSYTILAGKAAKAKVICFEPIPSTYEALCNNIKLNHIEQTVAAHNIGLGSSESTLTMTADFGAMNHMAPKGDGYSASGQKENDEVSTVEVPVKPLDEILQGKIPSCIKIDVEGFETEVITGAEQTLSNVDCQALIMELNGSGKRYGFDEGALHIKICGMGFKPHAYDPFNRKLTSLNGIKSTSGNTLYLKDPESAGKKVKASNPFKVIGQTI